MVPGSHRDGMAAETAFPVAGAVAVQLEVGDLVLIDGGLVHRATDNHSVDATAALVVVFAASGG